MLKSKSQCVLNVDPEDYIRDYLVDQHDADFKGIDEQTDTYFNVPNGRLKLREGNIENNLIFYERTNQAGPKNSHFSFSKNGRCQRIKRSIDKIKRYKSGGKKEKGEIYYINNVKFHIDEVPGLVHL